MTLLLAESFDWLETADLPSAYGAFSKFTTSVSATQTIETSGRGGSKSYKNVSNTGTQSERQYNISGASFPLGGVAAGGTLIFGFAVKFINTVAAAIVPFVTINSTATPGSGAMNLQLYRGAGNNLVAGFPLTGGGITAYTNGVSKIILSQGIWYYIECKFKPHDTTGSLEVKINGVTQFTLTNIDTIVAGGTNTFDTLVLGSNHPFAAVSIEYDDLYICNTSGSLNNDYLGDIHIELLSPNGNGNANQWLGSDADSTDNYLHVDDAGAPDDDTSYVEDNVSTDQDLYTYSNLSANVASVKACCTKTLGKKADAGGADVLSVCRSGTTETDIAIAISSSSYNAPQAIYETDPDTASAWTPSGVNSAEFGVEVA